MATNKTRCCHMDISSTTALVQKRWTGDHLHFVLRRPPFRALPCDQPERGPPSPSWPLKVTVAAHAATAHHHRAADSRHRYRGPPPVWTSGWCRPVGSSRSGRSLFSPPAATTEQKMVLLPPVSDAELRRRDIAISGRPKGLLVVVVPEGVEMIRFPLPSFSHGVSATPRTQPCSPSAAAASATARSPSLALPSSSPLLSPSSSSLQSTLSQR